MDKVLDFSSKELYDIPNAVLSSIQPEKLILDFNNISILPVSFLQNLSELSCFSANGNVLEALPNEICILENLSELYLKENCLHCLPESICKLHKLSKLHVTGNEIQELPGQLDSLQYLSEFIAAENKIMQLPYKFGNLSFLCHLDLSYNSLIELPDSFGNLKNLKEMDLSHNSLKALPKSFGTLPALEIVDLTNNEIKFLPDEFCSSKTLRKFLMNHNSLTGLPNWLSESKNVQELCFSSNDLLEMPFPAEFGSNSGHLKSLDLSGNNITVLPDSFGKLENLQHLDLGSSFEELERNRLMANGNNLKYLPSSFANLQTLVKLELDENDLIELPNDFGLLVNLSYLDLCHNDLKKLPCSFCRLKNLKFCLLSMNYLKELPEQFGMLISLEDLRLDNNMLLELPCSFKDLATLTALDLYNNKLKEIPTYLGLMKTLKHLDLRENDFGLSLEKIPNISFEATYLARKKEFKDSWRGRERPDINPSSWVEEKTDIPERNKMDDDIIYSDLTATPALWRKHGQSDERHSSNVFSITSHSENVSPTKNDSGDSSCFNISNDSAAGVTAEFWDDDLYEKISVTNSSDLDERYQEDLSDWESDSNCDHFKKIYVHQPNEFHTLIPSDMHVSRIKIEEVWSPYEEGQFDDAD